MRSPQTNTMLQKEKNKTLESVIIENRLLDEKRDIQVYHRHSGSAHIISYAGSLYIPIKTTGKEDFILLSPVKGPGFIQKDIRIHLPANWAFHFIHNDYASWTHSPLSERMVIQLPPGLPTWELKIILPYPFPPSGETGISIEEGVT